MTTRRLSGVANGNACNVQIFNHAFGLTYPNGVLLPLTVKSVRGIEGFALRKGDADALNFFNWIVVNTSNGWQRAS